MAENNKKVSNSEDFKQQDAVGKYGEDIILKKYLTKQGCKLTHVNDIDVKDRALYDFRCVSEEGVASLYEVKTDIRASETGNLLIETSQNNKPSGIIITLSDIWVHITATHMYIFNTDELRSYCKKFEPFYFHNLTKRPMAGYRVAIAKIEAELNHEKVALSTRISEELITLWEAKNGKKLRRKA